jgi:hypothetical protein
MSNSNRDFPRAGPYFERPLKPQPSRRPNGGISATAFFKSNDPRSDPMAETTNLFYRILKALRQSATSSPAASRATQRSPSAIENRPTLVVVEGRNDIEFLRRASAILRTSDSSLPDIAQLERSGRLVFVPSGGDVRGWAFRLAGLGSPEFHLYDRENSPTAESRLEAARIVNLRTGCRAAVSSKRSVENYLHRDAILEARGIEVHFSDDDDVADLVAERCFLRQHPAGGWHELSVRARRRLRNRAKSWLNTLAVDRMTVARFAQRDPNGEITGWLKSIAEMAGASTEVPPTLI